jgi:RHS repeat-associated protein
MNSSIDINGSEDVIAYGSHQKIHYLSGPTGLFGILTIEDNTETMHYVHTDYLGSYTYITDEDGQLVEVLSYDPWGRRRNAYDWTNYNVAPTLFDRGYTGHEHLDQFGLINMNGRMYDPVVSRMLAPDNFVQTPDFSQNFNRYSYALNNPLMFTDPDGEFIYTAIIPVAGIFIDAALWGAVISGAGYTASVLIT